MIGEASSGGVETGPSGAVVAAGRVARALGAAGAEEAALTGDSVPAELVPAREAPELGTPNSEPTPGLP